MITIREVERLLQTYSFTEVLDLNEVTEEDTLYFLITEGFLDVPKPEPIDLIDDD